MKRHLAIYVPSLRGGGAEKVMVTIANCFADKGLNIDLVLAKAEGPYLEDVSNKVRVVDLKSSRVILSLPWLVRYLRRERPVTVLSAMNHANVIALWAKQLACISTHLVVSERNTLSASQANSRFSRARMMPFLMRLTYRNANNVVAVSCGVADDLARVIGFPREKIDVVYNPIDIEGSARLAAESFEHPWFAQGKPPVILSVGRLTRQKEIPTLIRAFAKLREQRPAKLVILGEGELRGALQQLVEQLRLIDSVALPGFVHNPFPYMKRASVFVLSSRWEGLPNAMLQAMACGTPVVSTDCHSGPSEILENGKWGRMVPVGDVAALTAAMGEALDDPNPPDVKRRAQEFTVDRAVAMYLRVLGLESERGDA
jgi:glycosyltransferase involved in cell wall biosynthesis